MRSSGLVGATLFGICFAACGGGGPAAGPTGSGGAAVDGAAGATGGAGASGAGTAGTGAAGRAGAGGAGTAGAAGVGASDAGADRGGGDAHPGDAGGASTDGGGALCAALGWCELTNTKLADVCPDPKQFAGIQANEGCGAVINDWSGGIADQARSRLIVWGGGHHGYSGNEVYALDLPTLKMLRLNDPSDVSAFSNENCSGDAYADGRPVSRHTYDGLAYIAHAGRMFVYGGGVAGMGCLSKGTWTLDLASVATAPPGQAAPWALMKPTGGAPLAWPGAVSDYDPVGKRVILDDTYNLWSYDLEKNSYTLLSDKAGIDYHLTGRVDPKRNLFVAVGNAGKAGSGVIVFDLAAASDHAPQDWTAKVTGCAGLASAAYPGLAYDPVQDKLVGWAGGDSVYVLDLDAKSCQVVTHAGGPGPQQMNGTMGRFRYLEAPAVFAVVNDWKQNAFTLRLTP
jgi:hypothetical protein